MHTAWQFAAVFVAALVCVSQGVDSDIDAVRAMDLLYRNVEEYRLDIQDWSEKLSNLQLQVTSLSPKNVRTLGSKKRQESIASCEALASDFYEYINDLTSLKDNMKGTFKEMFTVSSLNDDDLQHLADLQIEILPAVDGLINEAHKVMGRAMNYQTVYEDAEESDPDIHKCNMCKRIASTLYGFSQDMAEKGHDFESIEMSPETLCTMIENRGQNHFSDFDEDTCISVARMLVSGGSTAAVMPSVKAREHMKDWHNEMKTLISREQVAQLFCQDADLCDIDENLSETVLESISEAIAGDNRIVRSSNENCAHSTGSSFCMLSSYCAENEENPCEQGKSCECYTGPSSTTVKVYAAFEALKGIGGAMMYAAAGPAGMIGGAIGTIMIPMGDFEISAILSTLINTVLYGKPRCKCVQLGCSADKVYGCRLYGPHEGFMNLVHKKPTPKNPNWHIPEPGYKCAKGALGLCWLTPCGEDETAVGGMMNANGEALGVFNCQSKSAEELGLDHRRMMKRRMYRYGDKDLAEASRLRMEQNSGEQHAQLPITSAPPVVQMRSE